MKKTESECVSCGMPCLLTACPNYAVTRYYCDECGEEETLYKHNDKELCKDCLAEEFEIVEGSND